MNKILYKRSHWGKSNGIASSKYYKVLVIHYFCQLCIANSLLLQKLYCITVMAIQAIHYFTTLFEVDGEFRVWIINFVTEEVWAIWISLQRKYLLVNYFTISCSSLKRREFPEMRFNISVTSLILVWSGLTTTTSPAWWSARPPWSAPPRTRRRCGCSRAARAGWVRSRWSQSLRSMALGRFPTMPSRSYGRWARMLNQLLLTTPHAAGPDPAWDVPFREPLAQGRLLPGDGLEDHGGGRLHCQQALGPDLAQ